MDYQVGNGSARQVACTRAHGKYRYQQGIESFSYPFTIGAYHIIAGRYSRREVSKSDHYRGPIIN
jgi:hypothetical protein